MSDTEAKIVDTPVVTEEVAAEPVETTDPVVQETTEPVVAEEKKHRKSFFDIFKRTSHKEEPAAEPVAEEAAPAEAPAEAEAGAEAAAPEVPVEKECKWKARCCSWCCPKKDCKAEEPAAAAAAEDAPAEEPVAEDAPAPAAADAPEAAAPVEEAAAAAVVADTGADTEGEAVADPPAEDIVLSGTLFKAGRFFKRNFHERHCRLLKSGVIQSSKTDEFTKAAEFALTGDSVYNEFHPEGEDVKQKLRLEIHGKDGVLTVGTDSQEDYEEWKRALDTVITTLPKAVVAVEPEAPVEEVAPVAAE